MLSKEDLLVMSYSRSKAGGEQTVEEIRVTAEVLQWGQVRGQGLTLSISVISVGHTAEALLSCSVPDLGGERGRKEQG